MNYLHYVCPESLEEAWRLNREKGKRIIAGGLWLRYQKRPFDTAIDLGRLGLDQITETDRAFRIGATVTLHALETHGELNRLTGDAFRKALEKIVGVQFRNAATVGGSVWSRFGFSDLIPILLLMDADVILYGGSSACPDGKAGEIRLPLKDFTRLRPDSDLLIGVEVPKRVCRIAVQTQRASSTGFPVMICDSALTEDGRLRTAIGARPLHAEVTEQRPGETEDAYVDRILEETVFGSNSYASDTYRKHLAGVLIRRNAALLKEGGEGK